MAGVVQPRGYRGKQSEKERVRSRMRHFTHVNLSTAGDVALVI